MLRCRYQNGDPSECHSIFTHNSANNIINIHITIIMAFDAEKA